MANDELSLRVVRNTKLSAVLSQLIIGEYASRNSKQILEIAVLLANTGDKLVRELGYRILLKHCIKSNDFIPLFDFASFSGFTPIVELLLSRGFVPPREGFYSEFTASYRAGFKRDGVYLTEEQYGLFQRFDQGLNESMAIVAPTSYGKSELIELLAAKSSKNIAIVVPSKALVSQTRRRVSNALGPNSSMQIVVHHDSAFDRSRPVAAIVTQERLLRIFQKYPDIQFDRVVIDEAHNLLDDDRRSRLLASVLILAKLRNERLSIKYLTPFLVNVENLKLCAHSHEIREVRIEERLKSEDYWICDLTKKSELEFYDQFLDRFFPTNRKPPSTVSAFLLGLMRKKNIVYLNRPKHIEAVASTLANSAVNNAIDDLDLICKEIAEYVHPEYKLLQCLRSGVAYHHGSVPDAVRAYVEDAFRRLDSLKWVVTSSTLLEGVNIPAEILFVLDPRKGRGNLTPSQFRNLVGRVNRFSEVFNSFSGAPELLTPQIVLAKCVYSRTDLNVKKFIADVAKADKKLKDSIENPILENVVLTDERIEQRNEDFIAIENIEPGCQLLENPRIAVTDFGRFCFVHSVHEIDVLAVEAIGQARVERMLDEPQISTAEQLMAAIAELFVQFVSDTSENSRHSALLRLQREETRRFYSMFFDWRINQSNYRLMISNFVAYWKKRIGANEDTVVFAGKWGDRARDGGEGPTNYLDISSMSDFELINLAIVRIKEEQDFLDNNLVKFLEVINDLGLVNPILYNLVKYGTADSTRIILIRNGLSHIAAHVVADKYQSFVLLGDNDTVRLKSSILESFVRRKEKALVVFEVQSSGLLS